MRSALLVVAVAQLFVDPALVLPELAAVEAVGLGRRPPRDEPDVGDDGEPGEHDHRPADGGRYADDEADEDNDPGGNRDQGAETLPPHTRVSLAPSVARRGTTTS